MKKQAIKPKSESSSQVTELQAKVKELTAIVEAYKTGEIGAEGRIKALTDMHSKKVKALLKSIDLLKKDVQKEKLLQQDNVRAKVIEQYKKDIESQDFIIEALRKEIGDPDRCDRAIVTELNKGPDRVRSATREELKIENKKLRGMLQAAAERNAKLELLVQEGHKSSVAGGEQAAGAAEVAPMNTEIEKKAINLEAELDDLKLKSAMEIKTKDEQIISQVQKIDLLKLEIKEKEEKIKRSAQLLEEKERKIKENFDMETKLTTMQLNLKIYEQEIARLRKENQENANVNPLKSSIVGGADVTRDEIMIQNAGLTEQNKKLQSELESEKALTDEKLEIYKQENEKLSKENAALQEELRKANEEKVDHENKAATLEQKLAIHESTIEQQKKVSEESYQQLVDQIKTLKAEKAIANDKFNKLLEQLEDLESQVQQKSQEIEVYQARLVEYDKENQRLKENAGGVAGSIFGEAQAEELTNLKKQVKLLTREKVELMEKLEEENDKKQEDLDRLRINHLVNIQKRSNSKPKNEEEEKYKKLYFELLNKQNAEGEFKPIVEKVDLVPENKENDNNDIVPENNEEIIPENQ